MDDNDEESDEEYHGDDDIYEGEDEERKSENDELKDLQECCVPEENVLEELAKEAQENFNLEEYLKFRQQLEMQEQQQQEMGMDDEMEM